MAGRGWPAPVYAQSNGLTGVSGGTFVTFLDRSLVQDPPEDPP